MWISTPDDKLINLERVSLIVIDDDTPSLDFYIDKRIVSVDTSNLVEAVFMKLFATSKNLDDGFAKSDKLDVKFVKRIMTRVYYEKLAEHFKAVEL